ncbi:MAG: sensor histidine kinase [Halarchaeum sp.]
MELRHSVAVGALDAVPVPTAVLDQDGVVVAGNEAWRAFDHFGVTATGGTAYVGALADAGGASDRVAATVTAVLDGAASDAVEYERSASGERRWYRCRVSGYATDGTRYVLVQQRDVTERAVAERALGERDEAIWASAAVLNHDLRNRITVARGWLDLLDDDGDEAARVERAIERADDAVADVVEYLRVGRAGIADETVDVASVARDAWDGLDADTTDATLDVRAPGTVTGTPELVADALGHVYENALAYAGSDASVTVDSFETADMTGFYVADDGPGIEPARRGEVLALGGTTSEGDTGYGLPIVARIAARHGWRVRVAASIDGGARIEFVTSPREPPVHSEGTDPRLD